MKAKRLSVALAGVLLGHAAMADAQPVDGAAPQADEAFVRWIDIYPLTPVIGDARPMPPPGCAHRPSQMAGWRATTGESLWIIACRGGNRLFVDAGAGLQPIDLPVPLSHARPSQLRVDQDGVLVHVVRPHSHGNCGTVSRYGWSADGELDLLERRAMRECRASHARDAPIRYQLPYYRIIGRPVAK
jgi:hypothetical protein